MKHFINLKDIPGKDLRKIIVDAKQRKKKRMRRREMMQKSKDIED